MSEQTKGPVQQLLRPEEGSKCQPHVAGYPYPRVIDWGMPEDVNAGDFTFSVLEAALEVGASEIQLTPLPEFGEVSVHFRIGSEFIRQAPLTQIQFGFIAILLAHIATPNGYAPEETPKLFRDGSGTPYFVRFSKIRVGSQKTAILIRLTIDHKHAQFAA